MNDARAPPGLSRMRSKSDNAEAQEREVLVLALQTGSEGKTTEAQTRKGVK